MNERIIINPSIRHGKPVVRGPECQCTELLGALQVGQPQKKSVRNMALSTQIYGPLLSTRRNSWKQKKLIFYLRPKPV